MICYHDGHANECNTYRSFYGARIATPENATSSLRDLTAYPVYVVLLSDMTGVGNDVFDLGGLAAPHIIQFETEIYGSKTLNSRINAFAELQKRAEAGLFRSQEEFHKAVKDFMTDRPANTRADSEFPHHPLYLTANGDSHSKVDCLFFSFFQKVICKTKVHVQAVVMAGEEDSIGSEGEGQLETDYFLVKDATLASLLPSSETGGQTTIPGLVCHSLGILKRDGYTITFGEDYWYVDRGSVSSGASVKIYKSLLNSQEGKLSILTVDQFANSVSVRCQLASEVTSIAGGVNISIQHPDDVMQGFDIYSRGSRHLAQQSGHLTVDFSGDGWETVTSTNPASFVFEAPSAEYITVNNFPTSNTALTRENTLIDDRPSGPGVEQAPSENPGGGGENPGGGGENPGGGGENPGGGGENPGDGSGSSTSKKSGGSDSAGLIAGLVIVSLAVIAAVAVAAFFMLKRGKQQEKSSESSAQETISA